MAIFRRKKAKQAVLPEIEKYYDAEKRERAGLAWLLALTSVAVVALIVIGAFFGGRWAYRRATNTDKTPGVSVTVTNPFDGSIGEDSNIDAIDTEGEYVAPPSTSPTVSTPNTSAPIPSNAPASTGAKELANTGPASTLAIFTVSVMGFTALHYIVSASRRGTN